MIHLTSRPPYGGEKIYFQCVYFSLYLSFCSGCPSTSFCFPWADVEFLLGRFGQPLNHFGAPWVALEVALVCLGRLTRFLLQLDRTSNSEQMLLKYDACAQKVASRVSSSNHAQSTSTTCKLQYVPQGPHSQAHFTRTGGQDDVRLEHTPSNNVTNYTLPIARW